MTPLFYRSTDRVSLPVTPTTATQLQTATCPPPSSTSSFPCSPCSLSISNCDLVFRPDVLQWKCPDAIPTLLTLTFNLFSLWYVAIEPTLPTTWKSHIRLNLYLHCSVSYKRLKNVHFPPNLNFPLYPRILPPNFPPLDAIFPELNRSKSQSSKVYK